MSSTSSRLVFSLTTSSLCPQIRFPYSIQPRRVLVATRLSSSPSTTCFGMPRLQCPRPSRILGVASSYPAIGNDFMCRYFECKSDILSVCLGNFRLRMVCTFAILYLHSLPPTPLILRSTSRDVSEDALPPYHDRFSWRPSPGSSSSLANDSSRRVTLAASSNSAYVDTTRDGPYNFTGMMRISS